MNTVRFDRWARHAVGTVTLACGLAGCGAGGGAVPADPGATAPAEAPASESAADAIPIPDAASGRAVDPIATQAATPASAPVASAASAPPPAAVDPAASAVAASAAPPSAAPAAAPAGVDIHVAANGNDAWTGLLAAPNVAATDGPVATLVAAQQVARARIQAMVSSGTRLPVRVRIQPGTYYLGAALTFTPNDSGTAAAPVSYEAVTPGTVTVSGAALLRQTAALNAAGYVTFENPTLGGNAWAGGGQLFVNGQRATLARQPNVGQYWFVEKAVPLASEPVGQQGRLAFGASTAALSWVNGLSAADKARGIVEIMHAWTHSQQHLSTAAAPAGAVQITPAVRWTFRDHGTGQRYFVENVAAALDAPGEFYWDASGVRYIPLAGETGPLTVQMPVLDKLIAVTGNVAASKWVENLQFRGIHFAHTRALTPALGTNDWQAASGIGAAIEVDAAKSIVVDNCTFSGTGGYGVWFRRAVRDSSVRNSTLTDLGAGGIRLGEINPNATDAMASGANSATGNRIGHTGKLFPGAVGVLVGQSFDNTVANNLIYNTSHTAILVGWSWDFGPAKSGRNTIADNLLVNIGLGELSDFGAIYTTGVSPGTRITGNVIREVRGYPDYGAGAWGIYLDSGTSQIVMANNIVLGADNGTFQATATRSNTLQANLFGLGDKTEFNVGVTDPLTALKAQGNVIVPKVVVPFTGFAAAPDVAYSGNAVSRQYTTAAIDLSKCASGCTTSGGTITTTTDPRGVQLASTDTAMVAAVAQTAAKAGPASVANASSVVTVATQKPPVIVAPPIGFELPISTTATGAQPLGFWYSTKTSDLSVAANAQAPGGRCLKFTDSPANVNGYDPHSYGPLNHGSGTTSGEFSLLIDSQTNFAHQWRDNASPAKTGPSLTVTASGVYVADKLVAPVSVGQWTNFKVTAVLGATAATWKLDVTDAAGKVTSVSGLPIQAAGWGRLNWWGFISNAKVASSFCLASVKATNVQ